MKRKCLRIIIAAQVSDDFLQSFIQKQARQFGLEGTAQLVAGETKQIRINVCGAPDPLDDFIDLLHSKLECEEIEIEPFLKDKDFRKVFRIIE